MIVTKWLIEWKIFWRKSFVSYLMKTRVRGREGFDTRFASLENPLFLLFVLKFCIYILYNIAAVSRPHKNVSF